jgi:acetolactate synthase-1/2/3 large subunit
MQSQITKDALEGATSCLALGSRLTEVTTAAWAGLPADVVRIGFTDERPPLPRSTCAHHAVDARDVCAYLKRRLSVRSPSTFGSEAGRRFRDGRASRDRSRREYRILDAIGGSLRPGDVLVCDMTKLAFWATLALDLPAGVRWVWPGMLNMGFGLPAAIGAAIAAPDQHVVLLCGDGGLLSVAPELDVAARTPGRLSIVMVDDDGYGLLRPFATEGVRDELCTFGGPDWAALASAFGLAYGDVGTEGEITAALEKRERGATLIRIDGAELCRENWRLA